MRDLRGPAGDRAGFGLDGVPIHRENGGAVQQDERFRIGMLVQAWANTWFVAVMENDTPEPNPAPSNPVTPGSDRRVMDVIRPGRGLPQVHRGSDMPRPLSRTYLGRGGAPFAALLDERIFTLTYFQDCMACTFCHDRCCSYGCDVDVLNIERLKAEGLALETIIGSTSDEWFQEDLITADIDAVGGGYTRTRVKDGACVFLDRQGRGCRIHSYALKRGREVRELKPMTCTVFPVTVDHGLVRPSYELIAPDLICAGPGMTAYRAARDDLGYYFGDALLLELDAIECEVMAG